MNFFYFDQTNQKCGPVSAQQLKELAARGIIGQHTPMETDTGHKGVAGQIPGLFPAPSPAPTQPVHVTSPSDDDDVEHVSHVSDYLIWSIITTICCCMPLGLIGVIYSVLGKSDLKAGNHDDAVKKSKIAFWCNLVGLILGLIIFVIYISIASLEEFGEM